MKDDLLRSAIAAHGGMDRWASFHTVQAEVSLTGFIWTRAKRPEIVKHLTLVANTKEQKLTLSPFSSHDRRCVFEPNCIILEGFDGNVIEIRHNPREAFANGNKPEWDTLDTAYFAAYTIWHHLTSPFLFAYEGFTTEEISPWQEDGETWRRLRVTYPSHIASHAREQLAYFGPDGLLRRTDFSIDVIGGISAVSYPTRYRRFGGIAVPTSRKVFTSRSEQQTAGSGLSSVTQISSLQFR